MKPIIVAIVSPKELRARKNAILKSKGKHKPKSNEPKIWFTSIRSLAQVLSDENQTLLKVIKNKKPESIRALADLTGRQPSNLSRTLKTLAGYGFVSFKQHDKKLRPIVESTHFNVIIGGDWALK